MSTPDFQEQEDEDLFGSIAFREGFVTASELVQAITRQAMEGTKIGEVLVQLGFMTEEQVNKVLEIQEAERG